jgi:hypothetical protein
VAQFGTHATLFGRYVYYRGRRGRLNADLQRSQRSQLNGVVRGEYRPMSVDDMAGDPPEWLATVSAIARNWHAGRRRRLSRPCRRWRRYRRRQRRRRDRWQIDERLALDGYDLIDQFGDDHL